MQWELLPGRSRIRPSFSLAGQLEPAYAVRGDSFDWSDDGDRLWLSAVNGSGEGVAAALLTSLATHALRNARRAGLGLADQAALADQAIYAQHRGEQHLSVLLMELDLRLGGADRGGRRLTAAGAAARRGGHRAAAGGAVPARHVRGDRLPGAAFELRARRPALRGQRRGAGRHRAARAAYGETALDRFLRRTGPMEPLDAVRSLHR